MSCVPSRTNRDSRTCARSLGSLIRSARIRDGRSLDELAPLAGLTVLEWLEFEAGEETCSWQYILLIANWILCCSSSWIAQASRLYEGTRKR